MIDSILQEPKMKLIALSVFVLMLFNTNAAITSVNITQANGVTVAPGSTDQELIRIAIVSTTAETVNRFRLEPQGTLASDFPNINIYYTGTSATYSAVSQFGATLVNPGIGNANNVTGTQAIPAGTVYFWVAVDVSAGAVGGNNIAMEFKNVRIVSGGTTNYGSSTTPAGRLVASSPMAYDSYSVFQTNTSGVGLGSVNNELIGVEIVTTGSSSTLDLTNLEFNLGGSSAIADFAGTLKVYYTGSSSSFNTGSLFDSNALPGGTFGWSSFNGTQALVEGSNYFWLAIDVAGGATVGNVVDARCRTAVVDGVDRITVTEQPGGNRPIAASSPSPGGVSSNLEVWLDANVGVNGAVTQWDNQGPNTAITELTTSTSGTLFSSSVSANYNNAIDLNPASGSGSSAWDGTFHSEVNDRYDLITGSGVTMYVVKDNPHSTDLSFNFHSSTQAGSSQTANEWHSWGFRWYGTLFSSGVGSAASYHTSINDVSRNVGFQGIHATENSVGANTINGYENSIANTGGWLSNNYDMELSVGYWPGWGSSATYMEAIVFDRDLSSLERQKVESYLAIKYGITIGVNGTSVDYISPFSGNAVWSAATNAGYAYDIGGIARCDISSLSQLKSHSTNGAAIGIYNDIVTIANGTNFGSPTAIAADNSFFVWGHDGDPTINTGTQVSYPTDNGPVIQAIFQREWKAQETASIGAVTLEFDMSSVSGVGSVVGTNDLANLILLVDEDGDFTNGATAYSPSSFNNGTDIVYFQHDFVGGTGIGNGFFFTLASINFTATPLPIDLISFEGNCDMNKVQLNWVTASEMNNDFFTIEKSNDGLSFEPIGTINGAGNSLTPINYSWNDEKFGSGAIYYRLKQTDMNGEFKYSEIIVVDCKSDFEIYPNPFNDIVYVNFGDSYLNENVQAVVYDCSGRIVFKEHIEIETGVQILQLPVELQSGLYFVSVSNASGDVILNEKLIKKNK